MDEKKLQQEFIQFLSEKLQAKDEQDLRDKVKNLSQDDMEKYYEEFSKKKLKKAAHGSKLQYFKRLKHQCAEDEELVYFKKGGSVGCGCVKKKMEGGEVPEKPTSIISRAKNAIERRRKRLEQLPDKNGEYTTPNGIRVITKKGMKERQRALDANKTEEETTPPSINKGVGKNEKGGGLKKNCGGATIKLKKKGGEVCPKCGKIHAAGTGCVAKFKKHRQGGSLNGIPFYQAGTPKGGLPIAPKAEDRYKNGYKHKEFLTLWRNGDGAETATVLADNKIRFGKFPATIQRTIYTNSNNPEKQDTIYKERPEFRQFPILFQEHNPMYQHEIPFVLQPKIKIRQASSKDKNRNEYETLKRRFNTAWNLAK